MAQKRKTHSDAFKARVAIEAIKGVRTLSELSATHGVHPTVIAQWKRHLVVEAAEVFPRGRGGGEKGGSRDGPAVRRDWSIEDGARLA